MASRRILNKRNRLTNFVLLFCALFVVTIFLSSCGTTQKVETTPGPEVNNASKKSPSNNTKALARVLRKTRSKLSDAFTPGQNKIPKIFKKSPSDSSITVPGQGYRIQILSSMSANKADSVAKHFRSWSNSVMVTYVPKAYVLFDRPYYKVRVGDFQLYKRAQKLTDLLKNRYPGAWVVHSSINPRLVPADTVKFKMK